MMWPNTLRPLRSGALLWHMPDMSKLFGTDGVRGTANTAPMTAETALRIGAAVGRYFRRDGDSVHRVVIG